jgi:hypothetical protein
LGISTSLDWFGSRSLEGGLAPFFDGLRVFFTLVGATFFSTVRRCSIAKHRRSCSIGPISNSLLTFDSDRGKK